MIFFFFLTFISLLNYIKIFQCIETLLGVEYIYIGLRREKVGAGYTKESTIDVMIDGYEMIQSESMLPTLFNVHVKVIMHMIMNSIKQFHFDLI